MDRTDSTTRSDRREAALPVIGVDRRSGDERRIPEWRRRALEQRDRLGYVAVADLTNRSAA